MSQFDDAVVDALLKCSLFGGVERDELQAMLSCLDARVRHFAKDERIIRMGDEITDLYVVASGRALVGTEDYWGNFNILADVGPAGMFGEAFACLPDESSSVGASAAQDTVIVALDVRRIVATCTSACTFHQRIVKNLMMVLARKNLNLTRKSEHLSQRSTRDKVLSYLSSCSQAAGSPRFDIPFNRQQLADYLSVERSALSACLAQMQREGLVAYKKNHFELP